jgi:ribosomal protein S27E
MGEVAVKFKVDKHDRRELRNLVNDIYAGLKYFHYFKNMNRDWKITYELVHSTGCADRTRIDPFKKSMLRGDIFPPIVMVDGITADGQHKEVALKELAFRWMPVASSVGPGTGEVVSDEVYAPLLRSFKKPTKRTHRRTARCIECGTNMKYVFSIPTPQFICPKCGRKTNYQTVLGWTAVNLERR